jgi:hypothetical protein
MFSRSRKARHLLGFLAAAALAAPGAVAAQTATSSGLAGDLVKLLDAGKLDSVAAPVAGQPDRFVAALYFPGTLLVVSGSYSAPQLLAGKLEMKAYRDVYIELNGASPAASRVFVQDVGADGLVSVRDGADSFDRGGTNWIFNRDWRGQNFTSEEEYDQRYAEADAAYADILSALIAEVQK